MAGYYSRYIKIFATIVDPLKRTLKGKNKTEKILWSDEMGEAFEMLKIKLTEEPILYAPNFDSESIVQTDALEKDMGIVLAQRRCSEEHPIVFLAENSRTQRKFIAL